MKDLLIVFLSCLLITSVVAGWQQQSTPPASTTATNLDSQTGTAGAPEEAVSPAAETSDEAFEDDVLKSTIPVLVDFSIPGCAPCRAMAPIIDSLVQQYDGRLKIVKLEAQINPATAQKYNVNAFPTFIIFNGGQPVARSTGAMSKTELVSILDKQAAAKTEAPIVPNEEKEID